MSEDEAEAVLLALGSRLKWDDRYDFSSSISPRGGHYAIQDKTAKK